MWERHQRLLLVSILATAALTRLATILQGTNIDEGYFILQGREVVRGYVPIVETQLNKGPLIVWLAAPLFLVSSTPVVLARLLTIAATVFGIWGVARLAGRWWNREAAIMAAAWYTVESFSVLWGKSFHVSVLLPVMSIWVLNLLEDGLRRVHEDSRPRAGAIAATGVLLGLAGMLKQSAVFLIPVIVVRLALAVRGRRLAGSFALVGGGAVLVWTPLVAIIICAGHLDAFIADMITSHLRMSGGFEHDPGFRLREMLAVMRMSPAFWLAALLGGFAALALRQRFGLLAVFILLCELIGNGFALSHFWRHYLLAAVPAASLLAGYGSAAVLVALMQRYSLHAPKVRCMAVLGAALLGAVSWPLQDWGYPGLTLREESQQAQFVKSRIPGGTLLNFTNPSLLVWTGHDLPWSVSEGRRIRIPGPFSMLKRGYLSPEDAEKTVEAWRQQDVRGAALYGIHLSTLRDKTDLAPLRTYLENDLEFAFEAGRQRTYYKELILYKQRETEDRDGKASG